MIAECNRERFLELAAEHEAGQIEISGVEAGQHHGRKSVTWLWRLTYHLVIPPKKELKQTMLI